MMPEPPTPRWPDGGEIDEKTLPTAMHVDWVKSYSGSRGGKTFTEFLKKPVK